LRRAPASRSRGSGRSASRRRPLDVSAPARMRVEHAIPTELDERALAGELVAGPRLEHAHVAGIAHRGPAPLPVAHRLPPPAGPPRAPRPPPPPPHRGPR